MCILPLKGPPGVSRAAVEVVHRFPRKRRVYPKNIASRSIGAMLSPTGIWQDPETIVTIGSVCGILASNARGPGFFKPLTKHRTTKEDPASNINHQNPTVEYVGSPCLVLSHCPSASALGQLCTISLIRISLCILCLY